MVHDFQTLGYAEGDCDDAAILGATLLTVVGIPARLTAIQTQYGADYDHVFCEARIGTGNGSSSTTADYQWLPIDPTVPEDTTYRYYGMLHEPV